jgi:excisionase family DNA binding protein
MRTRDSAIEAIEAGLSMMLAGLKKLRADDEWVDQTNSPLGRRAHLRAVRDGKLPGHRPEGSKRVLVRREDIDRYIATHRVAAKHLTAEEPAADLAEILRFTAAPRRWRTKG